MSHEEAVLASASVKCIDAAGMREYLEVVSSVNAPEKPDVVDDVVLCLLSNCRIHVGAFEVLVRHMDQSESIQRYEEVCNQPPPLNA
jgi:hypothetical protein